MDLDKALRFISFHESRKQKIRAEERASRQFDLSFKFNYLKELQRIDEKEVANEKGVVSSLIDSYHNAKDLATKNSLTEVIKNYYYSVKPNHQKMLGPFLQGSPISPMQEKEKEFLRVNPYPKDLSPEVYTNKNYLTIAQHEFSKKDHDRRKQLFLTGHADAVPNIISLDHGVIALRGKDRVVHTLSDEMLVETIGGETKKIPTGQASAQIAASRTGISAIQLLASGGWVTAEKPSGTMRGEDFFSQTNPITGESKFLTKPSAITLASMPKGITPETESLIQNIIGNNTDDNVAMTYRRGIMAGGKERELVMRQLSAANEGYRFTAVDQTEGYWNYFKRYFPFVSFIGTLYASERKQIGIAVTQGNPNWWKVSGEGEKDEYQEVFISPSDGKVRNLFGDDLGYETDKAAIIDQIRKSMAKRKEKKE